MKALSENERNQKSAWTEKINEAKKKLEKAIEQYNIAIEPIGEKVVDAVDHLNDVITQADTWRDDINKEQQAYIELKSERWKDSENGQSYLRWIDSWAEYLETVDLDPYVPEPLGMPECCADDILGAMPNDFEGTSSGG